jgi:KH/beta-lactamase-domain protein
MGLNVKLIEAINEYLPKNINIRIEFEGPYLVIYTDDLSLVTGETGVIPKLAKLLRKKIIVRPLPNIRVEKEKAVEIIKELIPKEAGLIEDMILFNDITGEIHLYALEISHIIGRGESTLWELTHKLGWKIVLHKIPPVEHNIIKSIDTYCISKQNEIYKFNLETGMRINRETLTELGNIRICALGGALEVGRSCFLIQSENSMIMLDAGLKPGAKTFKEEFPAFWLLDNFIDKLDAVIISHAHFDHCAALPYLFKYGYRGPVYTTPPTKYLMSLVIFDYLKILEKEGRIMPYSYNDVYTMLQHITTIDYGEVIDIAPEVKLTFYNAGHILGSSIVHLHYGEGYHNLIYTGDFKFEKTLLLDKAFNLFKRCETLIMESTYGGNKDIMPSRIEGINILLSIIQTTLERGGTVLIPVLSVGRAQEILVILQEAIESKQIPKVPIFVDGLVNETTAVHIAFPEYLSQEMRMKIMRDKNPLLSEYFEVVKDTSDRAEVVEVGQSIIISPSGMLTGGPIVEYLKLLATNEKNSLVFTSFQVEGTPGRKLKDGEREIEIGGEKVKVNLQVFSAEGFSGHSDRNQLINYIKSLQARPKKIILVHGEKNKIEELRQGIAEMKILPARNILTPVISESIKIR